MKTFTAMIEDDFNNRKTVEVESVSLQQAFVDVDNICFELGNGFELIEIEETA